MLDYDKIKLLNLFSGHHKDYIRSFISISRRFSPRNPIKIFREGDTCQTIWLIVKGSVKLEKINHNYEENNENELIKRFSNSVEVIVLKEGSVFGFEDIILKRSRRYTARTNDIGSIIYEIDFHRFITFFANIGDIVTN